MGWFVAPAVTKLNQEIAVLWPGRQSGVGSSDGVLGDASHQAGVSDHNPCWRCTGSSYGIVRASDRDVTNWNYNAVLAYLLGRCRSGAEKRIQYMISDRRIWSATYGWVQRYYSGSNPHLSHIHFSMKHDASNFQTHSFFPDMYGDDSMSAADVAALKSHIDARLETYIGRPPVGGFDSVHNKIHWLQTTLMQAKDNRPFVVTGDSRTGAQYILIDGDLIHVESSFVKVLLRKTGEIDERDDTLFALTKAEFAERVSIAVATGNVVACTLDDDCLGNRVEAALTALPAEATVADRLAKAAETVGI